MTSTSHPADTGPVAGPAMEVAASDSGGLAGMSFCTLSRAARADSYIFRAWACRLARYWSRRGDSLAATAAASPAAKYWSWTQQATARSISGFSIGAAPARVDAARWSAANLTRLSRRCRSAPAARWIHARSAWPARLTASPEASRWLTYK